MHYKNGREAKNGDKVVLLGQPWTDGEGKKHWPTPIAGVLHDAKPGITACNGVLLSLQPIATANLNECLHADDFAAAMPALEAVPDTSKK